MESEDSKNLKFGTNTSFTFLTYQHMCKTVATNFVICPFFAETLSVIILLGAEGETATELQSNLDCLICDTDTIGCAVQETLSELLFDTSHLLIILIKFYIKEGYEIKDDFKIIAETVSAADIVNIAFTAEAASAINAWVESETENKVCSVVAPENFNESTSCVIVNSLFFRISWEVHFMRQLTHVNNFHKAKGVTVKVDMMWGRFSHKYCDCVELNVKLLEKKMKGNASMIIVLPNEETSLADLDNKMDAIFKMDVEKFESELVDVMLPKFKIDTRLDYKEVLESRGIKKIFKQGEADLEGIAGNRNDLYINSIVQKILIEVNEDGVETDPPEPGVLPDMCIMFPPVHTVKFTADRPFAFFIKIKDKIIFVGKVVDPGRVVDPSKSICECEL